MTRFVARLRTLGRSALRGLRTSPVTAAVAVLATAVSLFLVGSFALLLHNMQGLLDRFGDELTLSVYLSDDLPEAAREDLAERLGDTPGVVGMVFVSKDEALARFQRGVGSQLPLLEALEENPLPASFELTLESRHRTPEGLRAMADALEPVPGVDDVGYGLEWVEGYARALSLLSLLGLAIAVVLISAAVLTVAGTIRLAVYARRDEIEILGLVGASRSFVAIPFLLEGLIQGALGAALALGLLYAAFRLATPALGGSLDLLLGHGEPLFLSSGQVVAMLLGGGGLGLLGSALAFAGRWWR